VQEISVRDIAERIQRPGETLQTAIDRVRNWTKEGFLSLIGDKNPGIGRARNYSKDALLEASLLDILSDGGMTAARAAPHMRLLMKVVEKYWKTVGPFHADHLVGKRPATKRKSRERPLLVISKSVGKGELGIADLKLSELEDYVLSAGRNLHTIVDLEILFDRLLTPLEKV
jgi:hypothetical protein